MHACIAFLLLVHLGFSEAGRTTTESNLHKGEGITAVGEGLYIYIPFSIRVALFSSALQVQLAK